MVRRVFAFLETRLRAHLGGELVPFAALLAQGSLVAALCLLVRSDLSPWGYALFTLFASAGLVALTLLGEFGTLLRADPAAAWSEALPATHLERRLGHGLAVLVLLGLLTFGILAPAALLAPPSMTWGERGLLLVAGIGQSLALGALLLAVQVALRDRIEGFLVLVQTVLVIAAVAGLLHSGSLAPLVGGIERGETPWPTFLTWMPPAWYAGTVAAQPVSAVLPPAVLVAVGSIGALVLLFALPRAPHEVHRKSDTLLTRALAPVRALARRFWVRPDERGPFELVYDALPLERDFVLRTYPMVGIPLAFLVAGARDTSGEAMQDLLALLLFTPAIYLPVLLAHVPATGSPEARWLLDSAPISPGAIRGGAIKALAVRFLLPLYVLLAALAWSFAGPLFVLRLAVPGALATLICLQVLYPRCVLDLPLSTDPREIEVKHDWTGLLITLACGLTILALFAQRGVTSVPLTLGLIGLLWGSAALVGRRRDRTPSSS